MCAFLRAFVTATVARRLVAVVLLSAGIAPPEVARLSGVSNATAYHLRKRLAGLDPGDAGGLLVDARGRGRRSPLAGEAGDRLLEEVGTGRFHTLKEIREWLSAELSVGACERTISDFLHEHGVRKLKAGSVPAKADVKEQRGFYERTLRPLMDEAAAGTATLLFVDASHFVFGCDFLGSVWCRSRLFVRSFSGRMRYNVLGALDYATREVVSVTNDKSVNADTVLELLAKIAKRYVVEGEDRKVALIMDNARYQHCKKVTDKAEELGLTIVFLPPYSPNLNLIERLWKMVKSDLRKSSWKDFKEFKAEIDRLVASTTGSNKARVESLIAEKVQLFDDYRPVSESALECPPRSRRERERPQAPAA